MYEFWYDYVKPKYGGKTKLFYMDTDNFIVYIKTDDIYKDIAEDVDGSEDKKVKDTKNVFTEEINKIALSSNDDKRMQSINPIEACIWNKKRSSK